MSSAKHYLPGAGTGKAPAEKSRFTQTCNRLSLFLKEKGSIRDLSFEFNPKYGPPKGVSETSPAEATTLDLLSNIDNHGEKASQADEKPLKEAKINLPEYVILDSSCEIDDATNKASSSKPITKPKTAQMTIFYGGQIMVLDDVPADRAREVMLVAKNGRPTENPIELASAAEEEPIRAEVQAKDSDLPIARRASLHKFLAKRKDRAGVRAPYQVHNQSPGGSSSGNEHSFDLNL